MLRGKRMSLTSFFHLFISESVHTQKKKLQKAQLFYISEEVTESSLFHIIDLITLSLLKIKSVVLKFKVFSFSQG